MYHRYHRYRIGGIVDIGPPVDGVLMLVMSIQMIKSFAGLSIGKSDGSSVVSSVGRYVGRDSPSFSRCCVWCCATGHHVCLSLFRVRPWSSLLLPEGVASFHPSFILNFHYLRRSWMVLYILPSPIYDDGVSRYRTSVRVRVFP